MRRAGTRIPGRLLAAAAAAGLLVAGRAQAAFAELPSPTALSTAVGLFYKTTYNFVADVPGAYSLDVKFTLVAP